MSGGIFIISHWRLVVNFYCTGSEKGGFSNIGYVRQVDIDETRYLELIKNLAQNNEFISRADVVQLLHVNENKAYWLLHKLVKDNVIVPVNRGRYAKYQLKRS